MPSNDQKLRDAGFKIQARPKGVEPRWRRGRQIYTQSEANRIAEKELQLKIAALKARYSDEGKPG